MGDDLFFIVNLGIPTKKGVGWVGIILHYKEQPDLFFLGLY